MKEKDRDRETERGRDSDRDRERWGRGSAVQIWHLYGEDNNEERMNTFFL